MSGPRDDPLTVDDVADLIVQRRPASGVLIVGITGSVAAGKTTFAASLAEALRGFADHPRAEVISTDGFLLPNCVLEPCGLLARKGFPETYDTDALHAALRAVRIGPADFPGYSHMTYDVDPELTRRITPPDILIIEGLNLDPDPGDGPAPKRLLDVLIYIDARETDIEAWFARRFLGHCEAAKTDLQSFYARFNALSAEQAGAVAAEVWRAINLPNLRTHIAPILGRADIIVTKGPGHEILAISVEESRGFDPGASRA